MREPRPSKATQAEIEKIAHTVLPEVGDEQHGMRRWVEHMDGMREWHFTPITEGEELRLAQAVAEHWRREYLRLATIVLEHDIDVCACEEGPYYGAQHIDSPSRCERCGRVTGQ